MGEKLVDAILAALDEQTVTVPGATAADIVLPRLAGSLQPVLAQRKQVASEVLTSMPGIGVRTADRILIEVGDAANFASSAHLRRHHPGHPQLGPLDQGRLPRHNRQPQARTRVLPRHAPRQDLLPTPRPAAA
jgi:transposase